MKIYGFHNLISPDHEGPGVAITEDGRIVAGHYSSNETWSRHDLGMDGRSTWKHKLYAAACPEGFELEFVTHDKFETHAGFRAALARFDELETDE